jgi:hypothetical protein
MLRPKLRASAPGGSPSATAAPPPPDPSRQKTRQRGRSDLDLDVAAVADAHLVGGQRLGVAELADERQLGELQGRGPGWRGGGRSGGWRGAEVRWGPARRALLAGAACSARAHRPPPAGDSAPQRPPAWRQPQRSVAAAAQRHTASASAAPTLGHHSPLTAPLSSAKAVPCAGHTTHLSLTCGGESVRGAKGMERGRCQRARPEESKARPRGTPPPDAPACARRAARPLRCALPRGAPGAAAAAAAAAAGARGRTCAVNIAVLPWMGRPR